MQDLEEQQTALAGVVDTDFRSSSLIALVSQWITGNTVIDVGCGSGGMVAWLAEHGFDAHGIDSSDRIIEAAHEFLRARRCDPGRVRKRAVEELVASGERFDTVISMDCLEHQQDDGTMFRSLAELVRPGGRLVVTVPAMPLLFSERDRIVGHHRRYTKERLRSLVQAAPLRLDELRYWNLLGVPPTFIAAHVTKRAIDESFRYGNPTLRARALRAGLSLWFEHVENRIRPPVGLTLFMGATRLAD